jgi:hypothetical protein
MYLEAMPLTPATTSRWPLSSWLLLLVVCIVIMLDGLDVSMVGVALPAKS